MSVIRFANAAPYEASSAWKWIPLLFSLLYFIPLFLNERSQSFDAIALSVSIYTVFVLLYLSTWPIEAAALKSKLLCLALVLLVGSHLNLATISLAGFFSYLAALHYYSRTAAVLSLLLGALLVGSLSLVGHHWLTIFPSLLLMLGMFSVGHWQQREYKHEQQQREATAEIARLSIDLERERIARDLHDSVGHTLVSIALKSELLGKLALKHDERQISKEAQELTELSRSALTDIRQTIDNVRTAKLEQVVLELQKQLIDHGFTCETKLQRIELPSDLELHLMMIFKEGCANVMRHSDGDKVFLALVEVEGELTVSVMDNGSHKVATFGNGLSGMQKRCEKLGGSMHVSYESGVKLTITFNMLDVVLEKEQSIA